MTRFASLAVAVVTLCAATAPVVANAYQARRSAPPPLQRMVVECGRDDSTARVFRRQHGTRPVFVTADHVLAARASGEGWSAPRCMTARERARLVQMMGSRGGRY